MDSADPNRTRRPRHDPEDSTGSSNHHRGRQSRRRNKKYRNRWLYGVLSCGGLVLIVLMVAIVTLQVVYFAKDNESSTGTPGKSPKNPGNDSAVPNPMTIEDKNHSTPGVHQSIPTQSNPVSSERSEGTPERGLSSRGTEENTSQEPGSPYLYTSQVIISIPISVFNQTLSTTIDPKSVTQKPSGSTTDETTVPGDHPNSPIGTFSIRDILLWLILLLFGVGVILVLCTVLFVKGYCRKVCPQKGEKFVPCACLRDLPESGDTDSRVTDDSGQRVREEFQMQNIRRPRDPESRSHDRDSANGTVRSSGDSIETSFSAPPPYCVAMTLPSVPNTETLQGRIIQTVINPPPAQVVLPSYEDAMAEGSALPS